MPPSDLSQVVEAGPQCGETSAELPYAFRILRPAHVPIISARLTGVNRRAILYHIGIPQCPKSTLADANGRRDYRIYEEFAKTLMHQARRDYAHTQLAIDVDNAVYALDASVID